MLSNILSSPQLKPLFKKILNDNDDNTEDDDNYIDNLTNILANIDSPQSSIDTIDDASEKHILNELDLININILRGLGFS
jgi:hypothetical protein